MRFKPIILLLVCSFCLLLKVVGQTSPASTPGNVLRIDFEGKHKIVDHSVSPAPAYQAGPVLRIDFEGKHKLVDHQSVQTPAYQPGPPLRVDFEGMHRIRLPDKN